MEILAEGQGAYLPPDPDGFRAWVRDNKPRTLVPKMLNEHEAIEKFVSDGDYVAYDCNYFQRGPSSLIREIIRQQKKDLWVCGKFTYVALALLVEGGCATRADIGFVGFGPWLSKAVAAGRLQTYEYSNVVMTYRLQAGAQGLPFIGVRSFGGTEGFPQSGAKLVTDPFSGKPVVLLPALNPDVSIIHVHQADVYGNARVFGTGISHVDCALASKKVIVSAEEIIETDEFRRDPARTSIPTLRLMRSFMRLSVLIRGRSKDATPPMSSTLSSVSAGPCAATCNLTLKNGCIVSIRTTRCWKSVWGGKKSRNYNAAKPFGRGIRYDTGHTFCGTRAFDLCRLAGH